MVYSTTNKQALFHKMVLHRVYILCVYNGVIVKEWNYRYNNIIIVRN